MKEDSTINWLDNLRAISTIAVIILHVSGSLFYESSTLSPSDWWIGNIFNSLVRFCVPIFLMLTGALLLAKPVESIRVFLRKRMLRILLPFLLWSFIYMALNLLVKWRKGEMILSDIEGIFNYILIQLRDGASYHFWYIYLIIGIYLFIPIISKWTSSSTKNQLLYFLIIWIIVLIINRPIFASFKPSIDLTYFSGYLGYLILGYYLTLKFDNEAKLPMIGGVLFIIGVLITLIGTYIVTKNSQSNLDENFYAYLSVNVMLSSIGIFLLFRNFELKNKILIKIFRLISKYSYGIYLSHIFVLILMAKIGINCKFIHPLIGVPLTIILCLCLSLLMTYFINKLPLGKYVSG